MNESTGEVETITLEQIKEARAKITKGEWLLFAQGRTIAVESGRSRTSIVSWMGFDDSNRSVKAHRNNAAFIANSPAYVDWLIAELERRTPSVESTESPLNKALLGRLIVATGEQTFASALSWIQKQRSAAVESTSETRVCMRCGHEENASITGSGTCTEIADSAGITFCGCYCVFPSPAPPEAERDSLRAQNELAVTEINALFQPVRSEDNHSVAAWLAIDSYNKGVSDALNILTTKVRNQSNPVSGPKGETNSEPGYQN